MSSNYLKKLPDKLYNEILKYIFYPPKELQRFDNEKQTLNPNLFISRCYLCKQQFGKTTNLGLGFNCNCNDDDVDNYKMGFTNNCKDGCDNQLICWSCLHN